MELTFDGLSWILLSLTLILALVHLVLLRKPDSATHPLLLGRQSELNKVRKPNESPVFINSSAGLGGTARQQIKDVKTVHAVWQNKGTKIMLGASGAPFSLEGAVWTLRKRFNENQEDGSSGLSICLEDPGDTFIAVLAASLTQARSPEDHAPLLISTSDLPTNTTAPLVVSTVDLAKHSHVLQNMTGGRLYTMNAIQQGPQPNPNKILQNLPKWKITNIVTDTLSGTVAPDNVGMGSDSQLDDILCRIQQSNDSQLPKTTHVTHKNILHGGIISILTMFQADHKLSTSDRILSFESTTAPYGLAVALASASSGGLLRLCSPLRGITSKCRAFLPTVIFCTPNELNAMKVAAEKHLAHSGFVVGPALAAKRSLLRPGNTSKLTMWDKLIFERIRHAVVGSKLRSIVRSASEDTVPTADVLDFLRIVLGVPIIVALTHLAVAGPVSSTMLHDYQRFSSSSSEVSHVGSPSATIEAKLVDVDEDSAASGRFRGQLAIKGPSVIRSSASVADEDPWLHTGIWALLQTNGTLKLVERL